MNPGTLATQTEDAVKAASDGINSDVTKGREAWGDQPPFTTKLSPEDKAKAFLPEWFIYGQAHDQVANPYWQQRHVQPHGPAASFAFDREMRDLYTKYPTYVWEYAHPQAVADYQQMQQQGLHNGQMQPAHEEGS